MVYNREEAARRAEATHTNRVNRCQEVTRGYFGAPSAGDQDKDGDFDAYDGWLSEPISARRPGDRKPPRGVPVSFKNRHGHRAISLGQGHIRSTDMGPDGTYRPGVVSTVTLSQIERAMGVEYLGWSTTIDGIPIPLPPAPKPTRVSKFLEGGPRYELRLLITAVNNGRTGVVKDVVNEIQHQVRRLPQHERGTRVTKFLDAYESTRSLRMGLLNRAIANGRTGVVKDVRARIMQEIRRLPKR